MRKQMTLGSESGKTLTHQKNVIMYTDKIKKTITDLRRSSQHHISLKILTFIYIFKLGGNIKINY